ncbi:MAG: hypothetical protein ACFCVK_02580 [Acidimicrobiales bacterium]
MLSQHSDLLTYAHPIVINLPEREDALRRTVHALTTISGRRLARGADVEVVRPRRFNHAGGFADVAVRSRLDAHLQAALWAERHDMDRVLVLEDDVVFSHRWAEIGPEVLSDLVAMDWDLASLGPDLPVDALPGREDDAERGGRWTRVGAITGDGSHAYLLSRQFLDPWIDHLAAVTVGRPGDEIQGPMGPGEAMSTITRISPWTKRYVATPPVVARSAPPAPRPSLVSRLPLIGRHRGVGSRA